MAELRFLSISRDVPIRHGERSHIVMRLATPKNHGREVELSQKDLLVLAKQALGLLVVKEEDSNAD